MVKLNLMEEEEEESTSSSSSSSLKVCDNSTQSHPHIYLLAYVCGGMWRNVAQINPESMGRLYRDLIIPLTKDVEVDYLMKRVQ